MSFIKTIAQKMGVDKAIAYSSGARVIGAFTGVASVFFITSFLTGVEQGFYYTFGSLLAMQVFFELGLTGIMTQYVAHEASHLQLDENSNYQGERRYVSRLASLVHFCVKWYAVIALIVVIFLLVVGFIYFNKYGEEQTEQVEWRWPWLLICLATGIKLFQSPFTSIITGLGFVKEVSKISFWQQLLLPLCSWLGLAVGLKLYVVGIGYLLTVLIWFFYVNRYGFIKLLANLWKEKIEEKVYYMKEIFPYQWRIALSWISGYFIFQFFNPVLFATEGAVIAGQMGMTLTALNAIQSFSRSWLNTKVPLYSGLIARKEYEKLDEIFNKTLKQMVFICACLLICFVLVVLLLRVTQLQINGQVFADRFLDFRPMILMVIPVFLQQFTSSWATYLRCHKQEPFLVNSIVAGVLCMLSTLVFGKLFGLYGVTIGYCAIQIALFPWGYYIYKTKKNEWHNSK